MYIYIHIYIYTYIPPALWTAGGFGVVLYTYICQLGIQHPFPLQLYLDVIPLPLRAEVPPSVIGVRSLAPTLPPRTPPTATHHSPIHTYRRPKKRGGEEDWTGKAR